MRIKKLIKSLIKKRWNLFRYKRVKITKRHSMDFLYDIKEFNKNIIANKTQQIISLTPSVTKEQDDKNI
jgi:predicted transcriptional regulator